MNVLVQPEPGSSPDDRHFIGVGRDGTGNEVAWNPEVLLTSQALGWDVHKLRRIPFFFSFFFCRIVYACLNLPGFTSSLPTLCTLTIYPWVIVFTSLPIVIKLALTMPYKSPNRKLLPLYLSYYFQRRYSVWDQAAQVTVSP